MNIINISSYRFVKLANPESWRERIEARCLELGIRGTVLLGEEGINLMLAGPRAAIEAFGDFLRSHSEFAEIQFKESISSFIPFQRLKVRVKNEIIAMRKNDIDPIAHPAPSISAQEFKLWLDQGKPMLVLDTRNRFEIEAGAFESAVDLSIDSFRQFPEAAAAQLPPEAKDQPLVMMCTGGIRCEKAAIELQHQGFKEVYQLEGGIIKYFELCGGAHYRGNCVVFDERGALTPDLQPVYTS